MRLSHRLAGIAMAAFAWLAPGAAAAPLEPLIVQQDWYANPTFGGFLAAIDKGFYAREGLDVTFRPGGPKINSLDALLAGEVPISIASSDRLIRARAAGAPVVAVATFFKRSPVVYFSLAEKNIRRPADMVGKRIRVSTNLRAPLRYMMGRLGHAPSQYETVTLPSDPEMVLRGEGADVWGAYASSLPVLVKARGATLNYIYPQDYGYQGFARIAVTTEKTLQENPELVVRFLRGSVAGWRWAVQHSEEMRPILARHIPDIAPETAVRSFEAAIPFVYTGDDRIGWMSGDTWQRAIEIYRRHVATEETPEIAAEDVFDMTPLIVATGDAR